MMLHTLHDKLDFDYKLTADWFSKISAAFWVGAFLTATNHLASIFCVVFSLGCLYICQRLARLASKEKKSCSE